MPDTHTRYLAARLRPPRPSRGVVARPRLDRLLELVRHRTLTVLRAPPGYGKTTVAQSWAEALAGSGARVAWLSLSAHDDDPERFFDAIRAAVQRAQAVADGTPEAQAAQAVTGRVPPGEGAGALSIPLRHRIDWLMGELFTDERDLFVVLDDFQEIADREIHAAISALLRRAPEALHLIVLGRQDPPLDLSSLRAHDAVLELDAASLCFDLAETRLLLQRAHAPHDAATLHAQTGGWIAALRATLLSLRVQAHRADPPHRQGHAGTRPAAPAPHPGAHVLASAPATPRSIHALFEDLLAELDPDLRRFLEHTCVSERLCAPLAEALTGQPGAQARLEALERRQLFVAALDEEGEWFTVHRLLREDLMRRLQQRDPALLATLQRRAAAWCDRQRLWSEAIGHALAAQDTPQALAWIEQHAMAVVGDGDLLTLLGWERQLRSHLVQSPLRLRLAFAWALGLAMDCDKSLALLDGVEAELTAAASERGPAPPDQLDAWLDECTALRAVVVSVTGDHEGAAELAASCHRSAAHPPWVRSALRIVRAAGSLHAAAWQRLYETAGADAAEATAATRDHTAQAYRLSIHGLAEMRQGHLADAEALLEEGMRLGADSAPLAALPAPSLAWIHYLRGHIDAAERLNTAHMAVNRRVAPIEGLYTSYLLAARLARQAGRAVEARRLLDEGQSIGEARGWRRVAVILLQDKVRLCLLDRRHAEAAAAAARIGVLAAHARSRLEQRDFDRAARWTQAWRDSAEGRHEPAIAALRQLHDEALAEGRALDATALQGSLALALHATQAGSACTHGDANQPAWAQTLQAACEAVAQHGAVRALLDQPAALAPLLRQLRAQAAQGHASTAVTTWIDRLLRHAEEAPPPGAAALPPSAASPAAPYPVPTLALVTSPPPPRAPTAPDGTPALDTLSPRERHVLELMAEGLSNKSIARGLGIAPETVKTHVRKIFHKLGAHNRTQAAAMVTPR